MAAKLTPHQNILQPKRLNSAEVNLVQKGQAQRQDGPTLTLNGVTIGLPSNVHHIGSFNSCNNATPAKKGSTTMAKRNARERNRVKQVNQGFQTLRQHIPDSYRMKKMSKVDTLRCALDYIRSMEQILEISPKLSPGRESTMRDRDSSSYHSFSSGDMNQHLDKICSMEESLSISLDQSFSSFSDNDESSTQGCLNSSSENQTPHFPMPSSASSVQSQSLLQHQHQEQCGAIGIVTSEGNNNNGPFQSLATTSVSSNTASIILPVLHSHSMDMMPSDENFNPPSTGSFIRVVEIIQLQQ